jgi:polyhydroxyalkanoate synthase
MPLLAPPTLHLHLTLASLPPQAALSLSLPFEPATHEQAARVTLLQQEAWTRASDLLQGIERYQRLASAWRPEEEDWRRERPVWRLGSVRLLDFGPDEDHGEDSGEPVILLIPSFVNRYHIFDLTEENSFVRALAGEGFRPYILDWGSPGATENAFDCADYVTNRLAPALEWIRRRHRGPVILAGYCMGGLLALAACAALPESRIQGLACFATPWDFSPAAFPHFLYDETQFETMMTQSGREGCLSAEAIQYIFHYAHPFAFQKRMRELARMEETDPALARFVAIECWAQASVPMTRGVARDCFLRWGTDNALIKNEWRVNETPVIPACIRQPVFLAASRSDIIVPFESAQALADALPEASSFAVSDCGHVGMMAGRRAKDALWRPFMEWVQAKFG